MGEPVRVALPAQLRALAGIPGELRLELAGEVTQRSVLTAVEAAFPMLTGTIRDRQSGRRRPFLRFYACELDLTHEEPDTPLPAAVVRGEEPFRIVGAMAGG